MQQCTFALLDVTNKGVTQWWVDAIVCNRSHHSRNETKFEQKRIKGCIFIICATCYFFLFLVDANVILSQECQVRMIWSSHVISECNYRQHSGWHVTQLSIKHLEDLVIECEDINVVVS